VSPSLRIDRRTFNTALASTVAVSAGLPNLQIAAAKEKAFKLKFIVASCMYGKAPLAKILPQVRAAGADYIEIWAKSHGNQREQIDQLGVDKVRQLMVEHKVLLGSFTCFKYGIFRMQGEMALVKRLGGDMVICNSGGPRGLKGDKLKDAIQAWARKLKPSVEKAEELGITIGLENHSGSLINSPDTQKRVLDLLPSKNFGIALAPYHLPQDAKGIGKLIQHLGKRLVHFQAWEHGMGCHKKLPKNQELMQLPGRGKLDFTPIVASLKKIQYSGRTEIFMHPVPRGIPILPKLDQVTAEINRSRKYLSQCLARD